MTTALILVPLFPLAGVVLGLLFGRRLPERVMGALSSLMIAGAVVAATVAVGGWLAADPRAHGVRVLLFEWIRAGSVSVDAAFWLDPLSAVMILTVSGVSFLIHVYSIGYMHGDEGFGRFFTHLNLFTFAMLLLVLADSLPLLFVGWEGVGLCSYLLIGFWFSRQSATDAAQKAFVVNRIGDTALLIGMLMLFALLGTLNIQEMFVLAPERLAAGGAAAVTITLLLFAGATGKSAQIPLHVWLPDAMEGPTPVSALIHAATMVTAGVYLVARLSPIYELAPLTLGVIAVIGAATALMAGSVAVAQTDIKRVLAYSTVSQLGFMFLALGVGAFAVGIFHLVTHAFFKALLFLGAGSVIHAAGDRQDMREMGGLFRSMPLTHLTMLAGGLALAGIPIFSGFFSKDEILFEAWAGPMGSPVLWAAGAVAALLTGIYTFRLLYLTFWGTSRLPGGVAAHESPPVMTVPLVLLAVGATFAGFLGLPHLLGGNAWLQGFLGGALAPAGRAAAAVAEPGHASIAGAGLQAVLMVVSVVLAGAGFLIARAWYGRAEPLPEKPSVAAPALWQILRHKYYFDEFYFLFVVRPLGGAAKWFYRIFDVEGIDGAVRSIAESVGALGKGTSRLQRGNVGGYAFAVAAGAVVLLIWLLR